MQTHALAFLLLGFLFFWITFKDPAIIKKTKKLSGLSAQMHACSVFTLTSVKGKLH